MNLLKHAITLVLVCIAAALLFAGDIIQAMLFAAFAAIAAAG